MFCKCGVRGEVMNDYELKGHSGCKLIVITQKDGSKIVKSSQRMSHIMIG